MRRIMVLLAALLVLLTVQCGCCTGLVNKLLYRVLTIPIAYPPGIEVITPESQELFWHFRLSPDRKKILYKSSISFPTRFLILNLETGERIELDQGISGVPEWIDDDHIYIREIDAQWRERPRLVINARTGEIRSIEEFSKEEAAIEDAYSAARNAHPDGIAEGKHYSPDGQYYYEYYGNVSKEGHIVTYSQDYIVIYSQGGEILNEYKGPYVKYAAWAYDSSGVYILVVVDVDTHLSCTKPPPKSALLKLPVSPPPSGPTVWLQAVVLTLVVFTLLGWSIVRKRRRQRESA